jgi:LacI family transcriptional regulator
MHEVAKLAKVGLMTVSRVINDHPSVRPSTKRKVQAAIEALGYQSNEAAKLLKGQRAMMIGLIVPDLSDIFFATCAHAIEQIARENGYATLIVSSGQDAKLQIAQAEMMARRMLSGLLIVSSGAVDAAKVRRLHDSGLTIVAFDRPLDGSMTDTVLVDNRSGAEQATEHLVSHGHKRIACVGYDEDMPNVHERVEGYSHVVRSHGLKPQIAMRMTTQEAMSKWVHSAITSEEPPTAIFTTNYRASVYLLRALSEQKIRIPDQVAVIGFDDFELAPIVSPPLTTVGQNPVDLASRAIRMLLERIRETGDGIHSSVAKIMLPATLIPRRSCGCNKDN